VRQREFQRRHRKDLAWYVVGIVVVQLGLAVGIDQFWPAVRDPDFNDLVRIAHDRQADAPGRPLVLVLGSSRTQVALNARLLNTSTDPSAPLVLNWAIAGSGPLMQQTVVRRMLHAGIRPQRLFVEVIPAGMSIRDGAPLEERYLVGDRFTAAEVVHLTSRYAQPYRLLYPWFRARVLPVVRQQAELREALGIDVPVVPSSGYHAGRDKFGWTERSMSLTPEQVQQMTQHAVEDYASALTQPELAAGALRTLRDLLTLCQREHIPVTVVVSPESSAFRSFAPEVAAQHLAAVASVAREAGVPVIDALTWVDDAGFYDGHHTLAGGATQFTERFRREALTPLPRASRAAASFAGPRGF
jgi:hypothetical protein